MTCRSDPKTLSESLPQVKTPSCRLTQDTVPHTENQRYIFFIHSGQIKVCITLRTHIVHSITMLHVKNA